MENFNQFDAFGELDGAANDDGGQSQWSNNPPIGSGSYEQNYHQQGYMGYTAPSAPYYNYQIPPASAYPPPSASYENATSNDPFFWGGQGNYRTLHGENAYGNGQDLYAAHPDTQQQVSDLRRDLDSIGQPVDGQYAAQERLPGRNENVVAPFTKTNGPFQREQSGADQDLAQNLLNAADEAIGSVPSVHTLAISGQDRRLDVGVPQSSHTPLTQKAKTTTVINDAGGDNKSAEQGESREEQSEGREDQDGSREEQEKNARAPPATTLVTPDNQQQVATPAAPRQLPANAVLYINDIASPAKAHAIIDHPDPNECQKLSIVGDDFAHVKANQQHFYAQRFFEALQFPGVEDPSKSTLEEVAKKRFDSQQSSHLKKVQELLKTPAQQKEARANCILAFDAGLFVHEFGVPKELYDKSKQTSARKSVQFDINSICSDRLEDMVQMVKNYKLIAFDLITGKKMHRLAYDAKYYAEQKIGYLISNVARQTTKDKTAATAKQLEAAGVVIDEMPAVNSGAKAGGNAGAKKAGKRKRTVEADAEVAGAEEEQAEEPDAKRAR